MPEDAVLYHLGCGDRHLDGYVNVDVRDTAAADITADLNQLDLPRNARGVFSHAFFEHLVRESRLPHLEAARAMLREGGFVCYIGLPDFAAIADQYLRAGEGITEPVFNLYEVYRYTHGQPEQADGWYFEQLHKSLFDRAEVSRLLTESGFASFVVFTYLFPGERVRVTMGFYAVPGHRPTELLRGDCRQFLTQFDGVFLQADSLSFVDGHAGSVLGTRIASSSARRRLRRYTRFIARQLARV